MLHTHTYITYTGYIDRQTGTEREIEDRDSEIEILVVYAYNIILVVYVYNIYEYTIT